MPGCSLALLLLSAVLEGSPAPPFALNGSAAKSGGPRTPTLIVFLDLGEESGPTAGAQGPSRSQADTLISVLASFEGRLKGVVVDVSPTLRGRDVTIAGLATRVRDWGLDEVPVVEDHAGPGLARSYGVTRAPSVFLLDAEGIVRGRWDRFVGPSELGIRLAALRPDDPAD
ncbi:MAG TPA: hypothetical protein VFB67_08230 [Candidatus Polarisedimenticolaceae bacterium]|nr:hypothetical protein [Candidatus Polarisedimenticolaceae bacterium]